MKIKITNKGNNHWYSNRIGEVFDVEYITSEGYWCREGGFWNCLNVVRVVDCEVLDELK